jgi:hypothetical protein
MSKSSDRRTGNQKPINEERRKEQRRKNSTSENAPVNRQDDWDKIEEELKDD